VPATSLSIGFGFIDCMMRDIDIAILSIHPSVRLSDRPSVCPSVRDVPVLDGNGLTYYRNSFTIR